MTERLSMDMWRSWLGILELSDLDGKGQDCFKVMVIFSLCLMSDQRRFMHSLALKIHKILA